MSGQLITEVADGIGWLIFDNQEKRNAIGRAMLAEFSTALAAFADDDAVRVVVLRGAGSARSRRVPTSANSATNRSR